LAGPLDVGFVLHSCLVRSASASARAFPLLAWRVVPPCFHLSFVCFFPFLVTPPPTRFYKASFTG
jgi:hypothetical protein